MQRPTLVQAARKFLVQSLKAYRDYSRRNDDFAALTSSDIELLARDVGVTPAQFRDIVRRGPDAAAELSKLLDALGIDETTLRDKSQVLLNDMRRVCAECNRKAACRKSIRRGTIAQEHVDFCNNAEMIAEARENYY